MRANYECGDSFNNSRRFFSPCIAESIITRVDGNGRTVYTNSGTSSNRGDESTKEEVTATVAAITSRHPELDDIKINKMIQLRDHFISFGNPPHLALIKAEKKMIDDGELIDHAQKKAISTMPKPVRPNISGMPPREARDRMELYGIEMRAYVANGGIVSEPITPDLTGLPPRERSTRVMGYKIEMNAYLASHGMAGQNADGGSISETNNDSQNVDDNSSHSSKDREKHGAIDQHGNYYAPAAGGIVDPRDGTFHHETAGGYVNTKTGEFMPAQ